MGYRCKYFKIQELVTPEIYKARGDAAWQLLQAPALRSLDLLREQFGVCTVNNWAAGGTYRESGLREFGTKTGAPYSQHKYGAAFDCKFRSATPQEIFAWVLEYSQAFPEITTVEDVAATPTWFHFDVRNHNRAGIWVVTP
jgi:hypothetical protein